MTELTKVKKTIGKKRVSSIAASAKTLEYKHEPKHPKYISDVDYKAIMELFFKKIIFYMIRDGARFVMPQYLGSLQIVRYPADENQKIAIEVFGSKGMLDWQAMKKLKEQGINKLVRLKHKKTNGFWWKLHWFKTEFARFRTQKLYAFKLTRPNIRPNSYNPVNPELSVVPYFRDKGWEIYAELPKRIYKRRNNDQSKISSNI